MGEEVSATMVSEGIDLGYSLAPGSPLGSWLSPRVDTIQMKVNMIKSILEETGDSFVQRAELFYKKRPQLLELVDEISSSYRSLSERYEHLTVKIRKRLPKNVQAEYGIDIDPSPAPSPHPSPRPPAGMLIRRAISSLAVEQKQADLKLASAYMNGCTKKDNVELTEEPSREASATPLAPQPDWSSGRRIPLLQPVKGRTRSMPSKRSPLGSKDKLAEVADVSEPEAESCPKNISFQNVSPISGGVRDIISGLNKAQMEGKVDVDIKDKGAKTRSDETENKKSGKKGGMKGTLGNGEAQAQGAVSVTGVEERKKSVESEHGESEGCSCRSSSGSSTSEHSDDDDAGDSGLDEEDVEVISATSGDGLSSPIGKGTMKLVSMDPSRVTFRNGATVCNGNGVYPGENCTGGSAFSRKAVAQGDSHETVNNYAEVVRPEGGKDADPVECTDWEDEMNHTVAEGEDMEWGEAKEVKKRVVLQEYVSELKEQKREAIRQLSLSLSIVMEEKDDLASKLERTRQLLLAQQELAEDRSPARSWIGSLLACS